MDGEKLQRNDMSKPVVWKILADNLLTERIEKYASSRGIPEAEVWREGVINYLDRIGAPKHKRLRGIAARRTNEKRKSGK